MNDFQASAQGEDVCGKWPHALDRLIQTQEALKAFIRRSVPTATIADDLLQQCLIKAIGQVRTVQNQESVIPWFYRLVRHAIIDYYRAQFTNCDLAVVIREVVEELRMVHGPRIVAVSKEELNGNWGADGVRRAVKNLITNAVKFGTKETPITVSWESGMNAIEITVQNEGVT